MYTHKRRTPEAVNRSIQAGVRDRYIDALDRVATRLLRRLDTPDVHQAIADVRREIEWAYPVDDAD
jgi:hypothetical protein